MKHISQVVLEVSLEVMESNNIEDVPTINYGWCHDVSKKVTAQVPGSINRSGPGHYWIEYNGLHYDAERPAGVAHPSELPCFIRNKVAPTHPDIQPSSREESFI